MSLFLNAYRKPPHLFLLLLGSLFLLNSCSSVGRNNQIKEFYCNGQADSSHRLTYVKGVKSTLLSPDDSIYDTVEVNYKNFIFEGNQFRIVGESALGAVIVAFKKRECDVGADNVSPYVCTYTIGEIKKIGCGEVSYIGD